MNIQKRLQVWRLISKSLQQNIPVILLYVLESKGSSPGRQGFCMAVNASNEMEGSIGGGIMEHKFVEMAKEKLKQDKNEMLVRKQIHDKAAAKNQSGMICSGEQTVLLYRMQQKDLLDIQNIIECLEENKNAVLELFPAGMRYLKNAPEAALSFHYHSEEDWLYAETLGYINHLHIIGGGHCALALAKLMNPLDFYIHLYEDRAGLNTFEQNFVAHEKTLVNDYSELNSLIKEGENSYAVIMTFGYRTDDIALKALLGKHFKYFGLLGSKSKIEKMFADDAVQGIASEAFQNIHAPVGLNIHSQTPEEIAVSIAAQIIKVKNEAL